MGRFISAAPEAFARERGHIARGQSERIAGQKCARILARTVRPRPLKIGPDDAVVSAPV